VKPWSEAGEHKLAGHSRFYVVTGQIFAMGNSRVEKASTMHYDNGVVRSSLSALITGEP
jgi:hypothetical protein